MRRKLLTDGIAIALVRACGMGLGLLVTIVIGRALGPTGLGVYGYSIILLSLLAVPVSSGWATLLLRSVSRSSHYQDWSTVQGLIRRGAQFSCCVSLLALLIALVWYAKSPALSKELLSYAVPGVLALVLCFDQLSSLRLAVLRGLEHPVWGQVPEMLLRPLILVALFLLFRVLAGPQQVGVQHAFGALLGASALAMLAGTAILRRKTPQALANSPARYATRAWLASAGLLATNAGMNLLNTQVDIVLLGVLGSFEQVGAYRIAAQIALLSGFCYTALNMLAMQRFALLRARGDIPQLRETATLMARLAFLGTLPLPVVFLYFGEQIIGTVFGEQFLPALKPLFWLLATQSISASLGMASTLLIVHGQEAHIIRLTTIAVVLNVVLCILLIPRFGMTGAAVANVIAIGGWNVALWYTVKRKLGLDSSLY